MRPDKPRNDFEEEDGEKEGQKVRALTHSLLQLTRKPEYIAYT